MNAELFLKQYCESIKNIFFKRDHEIYLNNSESQVEVCEMRLEIESSLLHREKKRV